MRHRALLLVLAASFGSRALAQHGPSARILVPISVSGIVGSYGTIWSTELWFRNNSSTPVSVFPLTMADYVPPVRLTVELPVPEMPSDAPGIFLTVPQYALDDLQFDLRLFNRRATTSGWGTKLPIVRNRSFHRLLN